MYCQLAEIPLPTAAQFTTPHDHPGPTTVEVSYSIRDHVRNSKRTMVKSIIFSSESTSIPTATGLQEVDVVAQLVSPSGKGRAVLRGKSGGSRFVEIWNNGLLETSMDVTDYHGEFYADEFLGSLSFSPSETSILYTAEGKAPESDDPFEKFRFSPDFGEGLVGKRRPLIFVFQWRGEDPSENTMSKASLLQLSTDAIDNVRFGQAIFSLNSENIIYATGYEFTVDGRMLGIMGCFNRPSGIWQLSLSSAIPTHATKNPSVKLQVKSQKLTPDHLSCRSPRIVTQGRQSTLIWLACRTGGAHVATSTLYSLDITSDSPVALPVPSHLEPLVGIVDVPESNGFPGLYPAYNLPNSPSVLFQTSSSIILHSHWGSRTTVLQISSTNGSVTDLTPISDEVYSWSVLATDGNSRAICSRSSPSVPYEIMLGQVDNTGSMSWRSLDKPDLPDSIRSALAAIRTTIIPIPGRHLVETILIQGQKRTDGAVPPCITSPHGGPHGASTTAFSPTTSALVLEGYTMSLPNYTGSPGYGEEFVQELVGRCGELDVQDCMASARHLALTGVSKDGPGMQLITGGSHGGFLTAHLIGQFPTFFSAAIVRNPVISAGEISSSDIRDWYFSEFGIPYPLSSSPSSSPTKAAKPSPISHPYPPLVTPEAFANLQAASPITHVDSVCVPVLLLIGAADKRVAPSQGIDYYHALKARCAEKKDKGNRLKVEMLIFEGESHPLDGVEAAKAGFEATKRWFAEARLGATLR